MNEKLFSDPFTFSNMYFRDIKWLGLRGGATLTQHRWSGEYLMGISYEWYTSLYSHKLLADEDFGSIRTSLISIRFIQTPVETSFLTHFLCERRQVVKFYRCL